MIIIEGIHLYPTQYNQYYVSKCGKVYTGKKNCFLTPRLKKNGYYQVAIYNNSIRHDKSIHRLVMETFIPEKKNAHINHINGNKADNNIENLEWCSVSHNLKHSWASGHRSNAHRRKVIMQKEAGVFYDGLEEAAKVIGIGQSYLSNMLTGKCNNWTKLIYV